MKWYRSFMVFWVSLGVIGVAPGSDKGKEKYRVPVADSVLAPETAEAFLSRFSGEIRKIKAIRSDDKRATLEVALEGDRTRSSGISGLCVSGSISIKKFNFPYTALALVFRDEKGSLPKSGHVVKAATNCMKSVTPVIDTYAAKVKKCPLFRDGKEVARLFLIRFEERPDRFRDNPRKRGD